MSYWNSCSNIDRCSTTLSSFYINLVIVDEDLEQTKDNILAPIINYDINTNNYNRGKLYN